jgi:signal transduction histidine kinase/ActR/RegA family two-component response regulator
VRFFSPTTWQESVRLYATLMVATVSFLAIAIVSFVVIERMQTERFLEIQDRYHLSSALAATSSELEIDGVLRNIELLAQHRGGFGRNAPPEQDLVTAARSSIHILKNEIARILEIQTEYGDLEFDDLLLRLERQQSEVEAADFVLGMDQNRLHEMESSLLALQRTLDQFARLHVIGHDSLKAKHLNRSRNIIWILVVFVAAAVALSLFAIRRGFTAISGLTDDQDRTSKALHESERRFRDYAVSSADMYWQTDADLDWRWTDTTLENAKQSQPDPIESSAPSISLTKFDQLQPQMATRQPIRNVEVEEGDNVGGRRWWRISGVPIFDDGDQFLGYRGVATDITEQKDAAEQSRQLQRIDAIGRLTGGVAHDFNNLLAVILGNLEFLKGYKNNAESTESIDAAIEATLRGADLTRNLLSFARRATLEPKRVELNKLVRTTKNWAARVLPVTIEIETSLLAGLWEVEVDPASMDSALLNLFLNARDAMPNGGKLTIETANVRIDEDYVAERHEDLEPGRYVMLAVSDTGHGIEKKHLDQVFEPFFTTKAVGEGSGLGLSMVQGFVKQSGGTIRVHSEVNGGTTFKLYFKALTEPAKTRDPGLDPFKILEGKGEKLLLVEDDQEVMRVLQKTLTDAGFAVELASSGDQAYELFKTAPSHFDLVVTDIVMPGTLQGPALVKAIREIRPDIPCVFMSGYANEAAVHGNGLRPEDIRLMKPVRRVDLFRAVSRALSRTEG